MDRGFDLTQMGSNNLNFRNFASEPPNISGNNNARPPGGNNVPLTRQSSVYSLTFDEFQSAVGGSSKDLGSMNMDELLKSIWTAEENQNLGSTSGGITGHQEGGNLLQKQGSLTLPRTLSQKTVEEVWRDMAKEYGSSGGNNVVMPGASSFGVPQREPTLGEVTLEEFLVRAGVAREDAVVKTNNLGFFGNFPNPNLENMGLGFGFQQQQEGGINNAGLVGNNRVLENANQVSPRTNNAASNVNTTHKKQQPQQILPKQPVLAFGEPIGIPSNGAQLNSPHVRNLGISDPATNSTMVQNAALGMSSLGPNGLGGVTKPSTPVSSDGLTKNRNGDASSLSPIPYLFNGGGIRGRKSAALEKVIERRQRRMIKNRESAARSRARKQAYTMELEAEVAKLKEENEELQKKQAEIMEMQKNQEMEMMNQQNGSKRQCLRRTQTGPW